MSFIFANITMSRGAVKKTITKMKTFYTYQEADTQKGRHAGEEPNQRESCIVRLNELIMNDISSEIPDFYAPGFRFFLMPLVWDESGLSIQCMLQEEMHTDLGDIVLSSNNTRELCAKNKVIFSSKQFEGELNILLFGVVFEQNAELNRKVIKEIKKTVQKSGLNKTVKAVYRKKDIEEKIDQLYLQLKTNIKGIKEIYCLVNYSGQGAVYSSDTTLKNEKLCITLTSETKNIMIRQPMSAPDIIPEMNDTIVQVVERDILEKAETPPPLIKLIPSDNGKLKSLLVALPSSYLQKDEAPYTSYINIIKELAEKLQGTQLVLLTQIENEQPQEKEQYKIEEIKNRLAGNNTLLVHYMPEHKYDAFSIWSQDAFLIGTPKHPVTLDTKYIIKPSAHQRHNRRNDGSIAKGVIARQELGYTPIDFTIPLENGNLLVADDFILIGYDEVKNSGLTQEGFEREFKRFFGDDKPIIWIYSKYTDPKKPEELGKERKMEVETTRELFIIQDDSNSQLHHDIYRWRGECQPLYHIDLFITLLGRNKKGEQIILFGEPKIGLIPSKLFSKEQTLFQVQFNDVKNRLTECRKKLEDDLKKHGIPYQIVTNPLPITYKKQGINTYWYWVSYNNCLVEVTDKEEKNVWLPKYGVDNDSRNPHWQLLNDFDEQQDKLLRSYGFNVYSFHQDFHFLASKSGSLHCMAKCLYRVEIQKCLKPNCMSDSTKTLGINTPEGRISITNQGSMLKAENNKLIQSANILQYASCSIRILSSGIEEISIKEINGEVYARVIVDTDFRERHGLSEKGMTFKLENTWVSFHIEAEKQGDDEVNYLVINSKPEM